jgi:GT2 family glycosyltransferase
MDDRSISVVICAYTEKRWEALVRAVASVRDQETPPHQIIVVVDHNMALLDRAKALLRDVLVEENREERGLAGARNSGVIVAEGEIIAFLDDDAEAAGDWLSCLRAGYALPSVLGVGGAIEPIWTMRRPPWFPEEFGWVVGCTYRGMPLEARSTRNLIGCNMSFRREVFAAIGGFQTGMGRIGTLPLGCEETEFCIRIGQRWPRHVLLYDPAAKVRHNVSSDREQWRYFRSRCYAEGRSKAQVAKSVGSDAGLSSERAYTLRTLPRGITRGLQDVVKGDPWGAARASAIVGGLSVTTTGYVMGTVSTALDRFRLRTSSPEAV